MGETLSVALPVSAPFFTPVICAAIMGRLDAPVDLILADVMAYERANYRLVQQAASMVACSASLRRLLRKGIGVAQRADCTHH